MSESSERIGSDLAKVDAHEIAPEEYEEIPELDDDWFARADVHVGGRLVSRGRPRADAPKQQVTLRLDRVVLDRFRASGPGWQTRMNEALRKAAGL